MKYKTIEERLGNELIGPWARVARELGLPPSEYVEALTAQFKAEEDAGFQLVWGKLEFDTHTTQFTIECDDTTINSEFALPALPKGWSYNLAGDVKRLLVSGKFTGQFTGEFRDGKFTVILTTPGFGSVGFNRAHFDIYQTAHKEVLRCLAIRLH